jgi:hypothetical protein
MDKDQFLGNSDQTWWLLEETLEAPLEEARRELGRANGWDDPHWYTEETKLTEVYQFLENNRSDLLTTLDTVNEGEARTTWLSELKEATQPETEAEEVTPNATGLPSTAGSTPAPEPPVKKSLFAKKSTDQPDGGSASASSGTNGAESAVGTDGASAGTSGPAGTAASTEAAKPSPFARKKAAEQPTGQQSDASTGTESTVELKESLNELAADPSNQLDAKEIKEILKDPDFEASLAQAESALEAELQAEVEAELAEVDSEG